MAKIKRQFKIVFVLIVLLTLGNPSLFVVKASGGNDTGGTITYANGKIIHTFISSGTYHVNSNHNVEILVVAGGGAGGTAGGGGGGAGGLIYEPSFAVTTGDINVTIGDGGIATSTPGVSGGNGGDSIFSTLDAVGGGGGGSYPAGPSAAPASGGSGGGANFEISTGADGTPGQGNKGGDAGGGYYVPCSGGGGAGEAGGDGTDPISGSGGDGLAYSISGSSVYYAGGGGGGGTMQGSLPGNGGQGGGGAGGGTSYANGHDGTANTGGGGGGSYNPEYYPSGAGGSGIVIISYPVIPTLSYSGSFTESISNDGSVTGSRIMSLVGDTFQHAGGTLALNTDYALANVPTGLTPTINVSGDGSTATLSFIGNATNNAVADSISNLTITFMDGAFINTTTASDVTDYTDNQGVIDFIDPVSQVDTGGIITYANGKIFHAFISSGTYHANSNHNVEVLVVGGGGGAGDQGSGGGGGGGLVYNSSYVLTTGDIAVTVGQGGAGTVYPDVTQNNGQDSVFDNLTAIGGGGASAGNAGSSGGSGGGGAASTGFTYPGGNGTADQGNNGGNNGGNYDSTYPAGGGGGAGGAGTNATGNLTAGNGGTGADYSAIFGITYGVSGWFAGGAGGSYGNSNAGNAQSTSGSGAGISIGTGFGTGGSGIPNTGGGGGAGSPAGGGGGNGGSGIVIISYAITPSLSYSGSFTESGANDGSVTGSRIVTLLGDTFTHPGSTLTEEGQYSLANKPAGLTPVMTVNDDGTTATLTFTGNATNNNLADSISNLTITFLNGAFTNTANASNVINYTDNQGIVTFIANPSLSFSGSFTEVPANDGSVAGSRIAILINDTFVNASSTLLEGLNYTLANVPAGLIPTMDVNSDATEATLTFLGNAIHNDPADSISDLTITFLDGAFTNTASSTLISGFTNNQGVITFIGATVPILPGGGTSGGGYRSPSPPPPITPPVIPPTAPPPTNSPPVVPPVAPPTPPPPVIPPTIPGVPSSNTPPGSNSNTTPGISTALVTLWQTSRNAINQKAVTITEKTIALTGLALGTVFSIIPTLFGSSMSFPEAVSIPFRLWSLLLAALGLKKRYPPWGTVYDSVTKQPLDPAYVTLKDEAGKEVASSITDIDGRYGFLVDPGNYTISVNKTDYLFPSEKLKNQSSDELYQNLYHGEHLTISSSSEVITRNIPMDPLKFNWNEFAKRIEHRNKFYSRRMLVIAEISDTLFVLGAIISAIALFFTPEPYNYIIVAVYLILFAIRQFGIKQKDKGTIFDAKTGAPLAFSIIRIYQASTNTEIAHRISDKHGKFYCLIPNGNYYLKIDKKLDAGDYRTVFVSNTLEVTKGILKGKFGV